jgi:hypothetical protein
MLAGVTAGPNPRPSRLRVGKRMHDDCDSGLGWPSRNKSVQKQNAAQFRSDRFHLSYLESMVRKRGLEPPLLLRELEPEADFERPSVAPQRPSH